MKFYKVSGSKKISMLDSMNRIPKIIDSIPNGSFVKLLDNEIYYRDTVKNEPMVKVKYKTYVGFILRDAIICS